MLIRVKEVDILLHMLFISVSLRLVYMLLVDILAKVYELYVLIFSHPAKKWMFVLFDFLVCLATDHSHQCCDFHAWNIHRASRRDSNEISLVQCPYSYFNKSSPMFSLNFPFGIAILIDVSIGVSIRSCSFSFIEYSIIFPIRTSDQR